MATLEGVAAAAQAHRKQGDTDGAGLPPGVLTVCREIYQEGGLQVRRCLGARRTPCYELGFKGALYPCSSWQLCHETGMGLGGRGVG